MVKKEFTFKGKTVDELKRMNFSDFIMLIPARERRSLKRGLRPEEKMFMKKISNGEKDIKTQCRRIVVTPQMIGMKIGVYNGKSFEPVNVEGDMVGHRLGEFVMTRKNVSHSAPGIGATKSSSHMSVK
jgi:small subunit ribosomal protein S19